MTQKTTVRRFLRRNGLWILLGLMVIASGPSAQARASKLPSLALDPTFGVGGVALGSGSIPGSREAAAVAVDRDGSILLAGQASYAGGVTLARYRPEGDLDPTYGSGGYLAIPAAIEGVNSLSVDADGAAALLSGRLTITRVAADGELDDSFGLGGSVQVPQLGPAFANLHLWSVAALPGGGVLAAGIPFGAPRMEVLKLLPDGSPDPSFGAGGLVSIGFGRQQKSGAFAMALQPDGDILLAGDAHGLPALARLLPDGSPDPSFGVRGRVVAPRWLHGQADAVTVSPDGGILLTGSALRSHDSGVGILLLRYGPYGTLDRRFGKFGVGPASSGGQETATGILSTGRRIVLLTKGPGPALHPYSATGEPLAPPSAGQGVPRDRFSGTAAALQGKELIFAFTPGHQPESGAIRLERFAIH